jgi:ABC-type Fe3+/spermidine/putrescine transport system ATPase subunit
MSIAEFQSVGKSYNGKEVLADFSLIIEKGERIVILGPSGCGKTTVLRLLAGFIAPSIGVIAITGENVAKGGRILKEPENRGLGMVFQDLALWPHLSVYENLEFGLMARKIPKNERRKRIGEVLGKVQMTQFQRAYPNTLSGGQQQRVALARALVMEPKMLLMDEPLSNLDLDLNLSLRKEILRLQQELGITLLYVTHDRDEAFSLATRVVLMGHGRIQKVGNVKEVLECLSGLSH